MDWLQCLPHRMENCYLTNIFIWVIGTEFIVYNPVHKV
jgi:hypothetical protein